jgi:hypothetical protein
LVNILTTGIKHEEEIGCIKIKEEKISYKPESFFFFERKAVGETPTASF